VLRRASDQRKRQPEALLPSRGDSGATRLQRRSMTRSSRLASRRDSRRSEDRPGRWRGQQDVRGDEVGMTRGALSPRTAQCILWGSPHETGESTRSMTGRVRRAPISLVRGSRTSSQPRPATAAPRSRPAATSCG